MAAAQGHVPLSTNAGSAHTWFPTEPPRPDRSYDTLEKLSRLWFFPGLGSALGLTDFYLRSPLTGLLKLGIALAVISSTSGAGTASLYGLIPLFLWGLWEFLHIRTEKERVVNYGLSAPFDLWHGVGQGMVTEKATNYTQSTNFTVWQVLSVLDFAGLQSAYEGKYALFIRKALDFIFFILCVWYGILKGYTTGSASALVSGTIFAVIFGMFVFIPYSMTLRNAINPVKMFKEGYKVDEKVDHFMNFFNMWTSRFGQSTRDGVLTDFGFKSVAAKVLSDMFGIRHSSEPASPAKETRRRNPTWPLSLLLGNIAGPLFWIFGEIFALIARLFTAGVGPSFSTVIETTYAVTEGGLAGAADALGSAALRASPLGDMAARAVSAAADPMAAARSALPPGASSLLSAAAAPGPMDTLDAVGHAAAGMAGGARKEPESESLSTEAIALGATVAALIAGGAIKLAVDSLTAK